MTEEQSLKTAAEQMLRLRTMVMPVRISRRTEGAPTDGQAGLIGLIDMRRIPSDRWSGVRVGEMMESGVKTMDVNDPIEQSLEDLSSAPYGAMPLLENGVLVGLVRYSDLNDVLQFRVLEMNQTGPDKKRAA